MASASNNFASTPVFTATSGTIADVTITDNSALAFSALTLTGNLTATVNDGTNTNGAVTQTGALVIPGTTTITATGSNVTLDDASNNFATIGVTGATVALRDAGAVILGTSTVSGPYTLTAGGAVTQSGALAIASDVTTISASGQNVTLENTSNNFGTIGATAVSYTHLTLPTILLV